MAIFLLYTDFHDITVFEQYFYYHYTLLLPVPLQRYFDLLCVLSSHISFSIRVDIIV